MPVGKDSKLAAWVAAFREWTPTVRVRFNDWFEACREEPILIWHTPAVRYGAYALGGLIALEVILFLVHLSRPGGPTPLPLAATADFQVLCTNPACGHHFVINRKFKFDDFPVDCPKCRQHTGQEALRCSSAACKGRWVVPQTQGNQAICPACGAVLRH